MCLIKSKNLMVVILLLLAQVFVFSSVAEDAAVAETPAGESTPSEADGTAPSEEENGEEADAPGEEATSAEEMPVETPDESEEELLPEVLSANTEVIDFFPNVKWKKSIESLIDEFAAGNYLNLVLTYVGPNDELLAKHKENLHFSFCPSDNAEGAVIAAATKSHVDNQIIVVCDKGRIEMYVLFNAQGGVKVPTGYPPVSHNFELNKSLKDLPLEMVNFLKALQGCGFEL